MNKNKQPPTPGFSEPKPSIARLKASRMGAELNKAVGKATSLAATAGGGTEILLAPEYANRPLAIGLGIVAVGASMLFAHENRRSRHLSDEIAVRQEQQDRREARQKVQNAAADRLGAIREQIAAEKKAAEPAPVEAPAKKQRNWLMRKLFGEKPEAAAAETASQAVPRAEQQMPPAQQIIGSAAVGAANTAAQSRLGEIRTADQLGQDLSALDHLQRIPQPQHPGPNDRVQAPAPQPQHPVPNRPSHHG